MVGYTSRVVVVGGGASGTFAALHLLWSAAYGGRRYEVTVVDPAPTVGHGVAYGTSSRRHLLNVPADQLSTSRTDPDGFVRWCARGRGSAQPGDFRPREEYARYLGDELAKAVRRAECCGTGRFEHIRERVVDVTDDSGVPCVVLGDGGSVPCDAVVLALGNPPPAELRVADRLDGSTYVRDPWQAGALDPIRDGEDVLLVGTGLTMVDVALELSATRPGLTMTAVSRHGLLPHAHHDHAGGTRPPGWHPPVPGGFRLSALIRLVRQEIARSAAAGEDWRDVIDGMRYSTEDLWRRLSRTDKERFLRHVCRLWDVHRHRMAPNVAATVQRLRESGRLETRAARIRALESNGAGVTMDADAQLGRRTFHRVVNCTGPGTLLGDPRTSLATRLVESGLARPDQVGVGLQTDSYGRVTHASGAHSSWLFAIGPVRRGGSWESVAIPEIRTQAAALPELIADGVPLRLPSQTAPAGAESASLQRLA